MSDGPRNNFCNNRSGVRQEENQKTASRVRHSEGWPMLQIVPLSVHQSRLIRVRLR